jgi:hypothetical protein
MRGGLNGRRHETSHFIKIGADNDLVSWPQLTVFEASFKTYLQKYE